MLFSLRILEHLPACNTTLASDVTKWWPNVIVDVDRFNASVGASFTQKNTGENNLQLISKERQKAAVQQSSVISNS